MIDRREAILQRLQDVLKTVVPGVTYSHPSGVEHREILTNLGGRVFTRFRTASQLDSSEMPYVILLTSDAQADTIEVNDNETYNASMMVQVWGFVRAADQGDGPNTAVRPLLNQLRADLLVAVECFPYWTGLDVGQFEPAVRFGRCTPVLQTQWTEASNESPDGFMILEYLIKYTFTIFNP